MALDPTTATPAPITPDATTIPTAQPTTPDYTQQTTPATLTPPAASTPATAPASSAGDLSGLNTVMGGAPPKVHGILGNIALSALKTLAAGARGVGREAKVFAENSAVGQDIQNGIIARRAATQKIQLAQNEEQRAEQTAQQQAKKAEEESGKAMDEHQTALLTHNNLSMSQVHIATMNHIEEQEKIKSLIDANNAFKTQLASWGIKPKFEAHSFDDLNQDHAEGIATSTLTPLAHDGTKTDAGLHLFNTDDLKNTPLMEDAVIPTDYHVDTKTGELRPTKTATLPAGSTDAYKAWQLASSEQAKGQLELARFEQKQKAEKEQADIGAKQGETAKSYADAAKANAEAKITSQITPPGSANLTGEDYLKTIPPAYANVIRAIGEGRETRSPRQLQDKNGNPTPLAEALHQAYPDFDIAKAGEWPKARNEYMGTGATAKKVVSYNTSMEHMQALFDSTTADGMFNPASRDYQRRQAELGFVANEVGNAIKNGTMSEKEGESITKGISGALTPGLNRERVKETAKLLHDKTAEYQTKFEDAAPSAAIKVPILMSPRAAAAYDYVQSDGKVQPAGAPAEGTTMMKGPDGRVVPILNSKVDAAKQRGAVVVR